jgi:hypothetical protein
MPAQNQPGVLNQKQTLLPPIKLAGKKSVPAGFSLFTVPSKNFIVKPRRRKALNFSSPKLTQEIIFSLQETSTAGFRKCSYII